MSLKRLYLDSDFHRVFNFKTDKSTGTSIVLIVTVLYQVANVLIGGSLQTAFLVANGIDIVRVGIITMIPNLVWIISIFSPKVLSHFKRRRWVLLIDYIFYYLCVAGGTTIVPMLTDDPGVKTLWFGIFLLMAGIPDALVGSATAVWNLPFIPEGKDRNVFVAYSNIVTNLLTTATAILASLLADTLAGSGNQIQILFWLRMASLFIFLVGSCLHFLIPREYPNPNVGQKVKMADLIREPRKSRPFFLTCVFVFLWGTLNSMNNGTWAVYLIDTLKYPLWYTYVGSVVCTMCGLIFSAPIRRFVDRMTEFKAMGIFLGITILLEFLHFFVMKTTVPLYFALSVAGGFVTVGYAMCYNGLFYINMPADANKDILSTFWNLITFVSVSLGTAIGTWILSRFEIHGVYHMLGMEVHGSQLLQVVKGMTLLLVMAFLVKNYTVLQPGAAGRGKG